MYRTFLLLVCVTFMALFSFFSYAALDELAFEAEDADTISPPMVVVEDKDVSGGAYIKSPSGRAGWAEYEIEFHEEVAEYFMWGMVYTQDGVTDSFFVTFDLPDRGADDDVNENTWDVDAPNLIWSWDPVEGRGAGGDPRVFEMEGGVHMLRIWTRENEAWLDCIFMSTDQMAVPVLASEFEGRERTGSAQKAVNYSGKLATAWGSIKTQNY